MPLNLKETNPFFMKNFLLLLFSGILLTSCATKEEILYFDEAEERLEGQKNLLQYEPVIQANDVLRITVSSSSINEEIVKPFQMGGDISQGSSGGNQNLSLTGYLVSPDGYIKFPVLGKVMVKGLTRTQIQDELEARIRDYVTDPIVDVRLVNFSVTVLGEVGSPGRIQITDGRVSMPELIAMVGDITYDGKRENIMIIREENGVKSVGYIDMTETDLFSSPYFYLKQNDIVYVEPSYRAVKSAGFFTSYQGLISLGTTIISIYILVKSL